MLVLMQVSEKILDLDAQVVKMRSALRERQQLLEQTQHKNARDLDERIRTENKLKNNIASLKHEVHLKDNDIR